MLVRFTRNASAFRFTSDKVACKSVTLAGSCTAWNMASRPTVMCQPARHPARHLTHKTMPSTRSSWKPDRASSPPAPSTSTWNRQSSVRVTRPSAPYISSSLLILLLKSEIHTYLATHKKTHVDN